MLDLVRSLFCRSAPVRSILVLASLLLLISLVATAPAILYSLPCAAAFIISTVGLIGASYSLRVLGSSEIGGALLALSIIRNSSRRARPKPAHDELTH